MQDKLTQYKQELDNTIEGMSTVKKQMAALDAEGKRLAAKANHLKGKVEVLEELISEGESNAKA